MSETDLDALSSELAKRGLVLIICETAIFLLAVLASIIGNLLLLWAVYRNSQLRTVPNYFIASLALAEILLHLLCAPQTLTVSILGRWPFNEHVCQAQGYFVHFFFCATLQMLTLTAINRFYRIVRTNSYKGIFTKRNAIIMIGSSILLAIVEPLPYLLSGRRYFFHPGKMFCLQTVEISVPNLLPWAFMGSSTFAIATCYFLVYKKTKIHQQNVQRSLHCTATNESITSRDIKISKTLLVVVVGFLLCWAPNVVIDFVDTYRGKTTFSRQVYFLYLILGGVFSSVINPFVYGLLNTNFRAEYKRIIFFRKRHKVAACINMEHTTLKRNRQAFVVELG